MLSPAKKSFVSLFLLVILLFCTSIFAANADTNQEWTGFAPGPDDFSPSPIDLRPLNEKLAGEQGWITVRDGHFVLPRSGEPVRFWAVNGPPDSVKDPAELRRIARLLAKRGVNLVRIHGAVFDKNGDAAPAKVQHIIDIVEAMKTEGIYSHLSIYFPLWMRPAADSTWLKGYDGSKHPFAALMFNPEFQEKYRSWWRAILNTPGERSGLKLVNEPALFGAEIQNEDSFFFWTFAEKNIPDEQLRILESEFGAWLAKKYGSIDAALAKWNSPKLARDLPDEGRVAFRPLWNIANEKNARDKDSAAFLFETQKAFYEASIQYLRSLGFKGLVCASNWYTASPEVLGPLEKLSYTPGDFIDRHGYFSSLLKGENSEWSIRDGHTYAHRSALRFENETPGKPRAFIHPVMDPHYDGKPSMISETTWTRPNRFRSEAPLYLAAYGALQDSDAIVHFAFDGAGWNVKPNFWMQPWTLMSPAMMGQFPAAALIYRKGLVQTGEVVAKVNLNTNDLLSLKGTPLPQDAALDELRLKDLPQDLNVAPGQRLDPLLHYVGRTEVAFSGEPTGVKLNFPKGAIDHSAKKVTSGNGQLALDYGVGCLTINSPKAQGASGNLKGAGRIELPALMIDSDLDLAHIILVPLDGQPLASSRKMLLQVMSEEQPTGWKSEELTDGKSKILSIGKDPWVIRPLRGSVQFKLEKSESLKVTPLDGNGTPMAEPQRTTKISLRPDCLYYYITL